VDLLAQGVRGNAKGLIIVSDSLHVRIAYDRVTIEVSDLSSDLQFESFSFVSCYR
jgi:hypothetical protein